MNTFIVDIDQSPDSVTVWSTKDKGNDHVFLRHNLLGNHPLIRQLHLGKQVLELAGDYRDRVTDIRHPLKGEQYRDTWDIYAGEKTAEVNKKVVIGLILSPLVSEPKTDKELLRGVVEAYDKCCHCRYAPETTEFERILGVAREQVDG